MVVAKLANDVSLLCIQVCRDILNRYLSALTAALAHTGRKGTVILLCIVVQCLVVRLVRNLQARVLDNGVKDHILFGIRVREGHDLDLVQLKCRQHLLVGNAVGVGHAAIIVLHGLHVVADRLVGHDLRLAILLAGIPNCVVYGIVVHLVPQLLLIIGKKFVRLGAGTARIVRHKIVREIQILALNIGHSHGVRGRLSLVFHVDKHGNAAGRTDKPLDKIIGIAAALGKRDLHVALARNRILHCVVIGNDQSVSPFCRAVGDPLIQAVGGFDILDRPLHCLVTQLHALNADLLTRVRAQRDVLLQRHGQVIRDIQQICRILGRRGQIGRLCLQHLVYRGAGAKQKQQRKQSRRDFDILHKNSYNGTKGSTPHNADESFTCVLMVNKD